MAKNLRSLESINAKLKGSGITLERRGNKLSLVSTLPARDGGGNKRQRIALGLSDRTPLELEQAEGLAFELLAQKTKGTFSWDKWGKRGSPEPKEKTIGEWMEEYKRHRLIQGASLDQWDREWEFLKRLPADKVPSKKIFVALLEPSAGHPATRKEYVSKFSRFIRFIGADIDLLPYKIPYNLSKIKPRDLPSDRQILEMQAHIVDPARGRIQYQAYQWQYVYRLIAAYGLRPHEVFFCEVSSTPPYACTVFRGKTGKRIVYPYPPEWAQQWRLWESNLPSVNFDRPHRKIGQSVADSLSRYGIKTPYNLRHAYSLRGHIKYKLPDRAIAGLLGHSVSVWQKVYSRWLKDSDLLDAYLESIGQVSGHTKSDPPK